MEFDDPPLTVLFTCLGAGLGGSVRSLLTVLATVDDRVLRMVAVRPDTKAGRFVADHDLADALIPLHKRTRLRRLTRLGAAARILRSARALRPDVIHANGLADLNVVAPTAMILRIPVVVWAHDWEISTWSRRLTPIVRRLLPSLRWATVSESARDTLVASGLPGGAPVAVIANPIDARDVVAERPIPHSGLAVGYLGSPARYKGFDLLPEIIKRVGRPDLRWIVFAGPESADPDTFAALRQLPDEVEINAKVADVAVAYQACDIVLCPSRAESFGRVVAEAMLNGLPVVASDVRSLRELVGDDRAGLLFRPEDVAGAAHAIERLVDDPLLCAKLGEQGRRLSAAFEPAAVSDDLFALYQPVGR